MSKNIEDAYPLSPMQQGMLFHSLYEPDSGVYVEQMSCTLQGPLNVPLFERAWQSVVDRHPILRSAFVWEGVPAPLQVVGRQVRLSVEAHDWRAMPEAEQEALLAELLQADRVRGFKLSKAPLMRLTLHRTGEERYHFLWSYHHILLDGWCLPLVLREVFAFYEALADGRELYLERPRPYRDYIAWLQKQDSSRAEAFWRQSLRGFTTPTPLVVDQLVDETLRPSATPPGVQQLSLSEESTARLQALAQQHHLTMNTLVQGAWALLLGRYSGQRDVLFGSVVSGRPAELPGVEAMIGLFINTLPVRVPLPPDMGLIPWLQALQAQQVEMRQYEYTPLVEVQGWSEAPRGHPLFESIIIFENYPLDSSLKEHRGSIEVVSAEPFEQVNYPLALSTRPGATLPLILTYDGSRFTTGAIRRLLEHLRTLLERMAARPEHPLAELPLLGDAERQQLLVEWNQSEAAYPDDTTFHEWVERQATRQPDAVALVAGEARVSYGELNTRANQLAHWLQTQGVGPEARVAVCLERSIEMVVALLGILKAGGVYVPIDPSYPAERQQFMLKDSQARLCLTAAILAQARDAIAQQPSSTPLPSCSPESLAYIIYTSGSTGQPKGTLLAHRGLCNLAQAQITLFGVDAESRVLQFASPSFDASISEIAMALLAGGTLYLTPRERLQPGPEVVELLQQQGISVVTLPPSLLALLPAEELPALRTVISAGESCSAEIVRRWSVGRRFFNAYGPSESTVCATAIECREDGQRPSIGTPIANTQVYLLDSNMQPVPVGVTGELYIGGVGLARGYLNQPALTAERFLPNPFSQEPGSRLYKSGDLGRYRPNGEIDFLGRADQQVKVRGFRIELEEIEAVLRQHPGVRDAVVIARGEAQSERGLAAYLVPDPASPAAIRELRDFLQQRLPEYMVPGLFMVLDALPLTPNGKVDRRALPEPERGQLLQASYVAPRTPLEEMLASVWETILKVEQVGVHDNFFELGGHSLLATQLASRLRSLFNIDLPLRDLFASPTLALLAERVERARRAAEGVEMPPLQVASREGTLPLSFAQQRLWFIDQLEPENSAYNVPTAVRLRGALNVAALEASLNEIVRRHEVLRTAFDTVLGEPVQVIAPSVRIPMPLIDLRMFPAPERAGEATRLLLQEVQRPFDLTRGPLLRAKLIRLEDEETIALLVMHHIISDGWSMGVLVQEMAALYAAFSQEQPSPLPPLPLQYLDYALWQRAWMQGDMLEQQLAYWREQLGGELPALELPTDHPRPAIQSYEGHSVKVTLPAALSRALRALGQREGSTLFMTLLAAFEVLLHRYSGQSDFALGTPIAGRTHEALEGLIGFFVNTLVLRADLAGNPTFRELLRRVRETALGAYAHQDTPFEKLVDELHPARDLSRSPLFQVMFTLQNMPTPTIVGGSSRLEITPMEVEGNRAQFDLSLTLIEGGEQIEGSLEYSTALFDEATMRRMVRHFEQLLEGIVANPEQRLASLLPLNERERQQLLHEWNDTTRPYPTRCLHELFEAQAARAPEAIALRHEDEALSYAALNQRANQLAHWLIGQGVGPDVRVALCLERSIEMIVALLGILKAGGAYVPIDPSYPAERQTFLLEASQARLCLTPALLAEVREAIAQQPSGNPSLPLSTANLAYLIYTSGSTGTPKGVMVSHASLVNYLHAAREMYEIGPEDQMLQFASISFDTAAEEIYPPLLAGATLLLRDDAMLGSVPAFLERCEQWGVTVLDLPTAYWHSLVDALGQAASPLPASLRLLLIGGEKASAERLARWQTLAAPSIRLVNTYGPTEATIVATTCDLEKIPSQREIPIGRPVPNVRAYVLDGYGQPVPVGVAGELCIGGAGVARGYLNQPALTAERFVPDPFSAEPGARLYRTGDRARYLPDGNLLFVGRADEQVKIRGFRIEPGEIEAVLAQHPAVREAIVLAHESEGRGTRLAAYVVAEAASPDELRAFLKEKLPEYMVPAFFVPLEAIPLTANGKLDRRALPAPTQGLAERGEGLVLPRSEVEEQLAAIWSQLLGIEQVGIHDNFFALGGDSILSIQIIARANQVGIELTPKHLFQYQTIAELAAVAGSRQPIQAEQGLVTGEVPLTPIQREFLESDVVAPHHFNQALMLQVEPMPDPYLLAKTFEHLLLHHDALRIRFARTDEGGWQQHNEAAIAEVPFTVEALRALPEPEQRIAIEQRAAALQASLNLTDGPLMRFALFDLGEGRPARLLLVIHHLLVDGVSWRVLLEDVQSIYQQLSQGVPVQLPRKSTSFQQWAARLTAHAQSEAVRQEASYWLNEARRQVRALPLNFPGGANTNTLAEVVSVSLEVEETRALLQEVPKVYSTQINDVLLAAVGEAFARWGGSRTLLVGLEGHGREPLFEDVDLSRTVGWFTAIYPLLLTLGTHFEPGELLKSVKEQLREVPNHGIGYGLLRYLGDDETLAARLKTLPQPEVSFNYLGQFDQILPDDSAFSPAPEATGPYCSPESQRAYLIDITGYVGGGQLRLDWSYSSGLHRPESIARLAGYFVEALRALIAHCQAPEAGGFTPSDFPEADLSQEDLDSILAELGE